MRKPRPAKWAPRAVGVVSVLAVVGLCASDFFTQFWVEHPMITAVLAAVVVLGVTVAIVDEYVSASQARRWTVVAVIALNELAEAAHKVRVAILELLGLERGMQAQAFLDLVATPDGAQRVSEALYAVAGDPGRTGPLLKLVRELLEQQREVMTRWAAVMTQRAPHAAAIERFGEIHARLLRLAQELVAQQEGSEEALGPDWVAGRIATLLESTAQLELVFARAGSEAVPKAHFMGRPGWVREPAARGRTGA
jgi:hypothetical protein